MSAELSAGDEVVGQWAASMIGRDEEPLVEEANEGTTCPVRCKLTFGTVIVLVTKSRCTMCSRACQTVNQMAQRVASDLRGDLSQRATVRFVAQVISDALEVSGSRSRGNTEPTINSLMLQASLPSFGLAIWVLVAVEPVTSGGAQWAYAFGSRGSAAAFLTDSTNSLHSDVYIRSDSSSSPYASPMDSSHSSPRSVQTSPRLSSRASWSPRVSEELSSTFGVCAPSDALLVLVEPLFRSSLQQPVAPQQSSSPRVSVSRGWKRASASPLAWPEPIRAVARSHLMEFDAWDQIESLNDFLGDRIRPKRPDVSVSLLVVPPAVSLGPLEVFSGNLFGDAAEHVPLGVLVVQLKQQVVIFVRTIPFGSLECTPHEDHVTLYLHRRKDSLGQSHATKWEDMQKTPIDELSKMNAERTVILPTLIDPESQEILVMENGVIRVEYSIVSSPSIPITSPSPRGTPPRISGISINRRSIFNKKSL